METYISTILKPFNFSLMKVEISTILATICTILSTFATNYLGISGAFAMVLFILLVTDFFTGIAAAKYNKRKITSRRGLRTLYKAGAYVLFIYVSFNLHKELEGKAELFETIIKYFHIYIIVHVSFWELFSIDENFKKIGLDLGITALLKNAYQGVKRIFNRIGEPQEPEEYNDDYEDEEELQ